VFVDQKGRTLLLPPPVRVGQRKVRSAADDVPTLVSRMWHFPTIAARENPELQILQSLSSLVGASSQPLELVPLEPVRHAVTYRDITIFAFAIPCAELPRTPAAKALPLSDVSALAVSNLTRKVARAALALSSRENSGKKKQAAAQGRLQPTL